MKKITGLFAMTVFSVLMTIGLFSCSNNSSAAVAGNGGQDGSAIEVVGRITGKLVYEDGSPASGASVRSFKPTMGVAPTGRDITADNKISEKDGSFILNTYAIGDYSVFANDMKGKGLYKGCSVDKKGATVDLGTLVLKKLGSIRGIIIPPSDSTNNTSALDYYVILPGLGRGVKIDTISGIFSADSIPVGTYTLRINPLYASSTQYLVTKDTTIVVTNPSPESLDTFFMKSRSEINYPPEYYADTLIVREILDSNRHFDALVAGASGVNEKGRIVQLTLFINDKNILIPPCIEKLKTLEFLFLFSLGGLGTLDTMPKSICHLPSLYRLTMTGFGLKHLPDSLQYLPKLTILELYNNDFEEIPPVLAKLSALSNLDLRNNRIRDLHPARSMPIIPTLNLNTNYIQNVTQEDEKWFTNVYMQGSKTYFDDFMAHQKKDTARVIH